MGGSAKLRVASLGCGPRALAHMEAMQNSGAVELVAACDLDEQRLSAAGERFDIPRLYRGMAEMIEKERPQEDQGVERAWGASHRRPDWNACQSLGTSCPID